ncbi:MAG: hypothetical protein AAGL98_13295, partial [Planctomycetota bacterium]
MTKSFLPRWKFNGCVFVIRGPGGVAAGLVAVLCVASHGQSSEHLTDEAKPTAQVLEDYGTAGPTPVSLTLFFENDGSFVRPQDDDDRHYTSGQGISWVYHHTGGR